MSKRIAIALGSPRRAKSVSRTAALYFAKFLDHDHETVDLARLKLPASPDEPGPPELEAVVEKLRSADAVSGRSSRSLDDLLGNAKRSYGDVQLHPTCSV